MNKSIIEVNQISKVYRIDPTNSSSGARTLQEDILRMFRRRTNTRRSKEEVWALKNVSFKVYQGDVVGLIGRNGAGKSTLLKILSRITEPTSGYADIFGRVGSLLEVGTGFHSELTGRENIYLSGSILGMRKDEITRKFDEIVDFSGIEKFIDTPVKHYSSGMAVRLAFAVAAHLEPEVLLIDEVLAVGDAAFQKKSLGKISEVASEGRTVIFVSHNMAAIKTLCTRGILLEGGYKYLDDRIDLVVNNYLSKLNEGGNILALSSRNDLNGTGDAKLVSFYINGQMGKDFHLWMGEDVHIKFVIKVYQELKNPVYGVFFVQNGETILRAFSRESVLDVPPLDIGVGSVSCTLKKLPLMHGKYSIAIWLGEPKICHQYAENVANVTINADDVYSTGILPSETNSGLCFTNQEWKFDLPG